MPIYEDEVIRLAISMYFEQRGEGADQPSIGLSDAQVDEDGTVTVHLRNAQGDLATLRIAESVLSMVDEDDVSAEVAEVLKQVVNNCERTEVISSMGFDSSTTVAVAEEAVSAYNQSRAEAQAERDESNN